MQRDDTAGAARSPRLELVGPSRGPRDPAAATEPTPSAMEARVKGAGGERQRSLDAGRAEGRCTDAPKTSQFHGVWRGLGGSMPPCSTVTGNRVTGDLLKPWMVRGDWHQTATVGEACASLRPSVRRWAGRLGINGSAVERAAMSKLRAVEMPVLERLRCAPYNVAQRVATCGKLDPTFEMVGGVLKQTGARMYACGLRKVCPRCARAKARELGEQLRAHVEHRRDELVEQHGDDGARRLVFMTATQQDKRVDRERAADAYARMAGSCQALYGRTRARVEPDRRAYPERWARWVWQRLVAGAFESIEMTVSGRQSGKRARKRYRWHPHAHMLLELHAPDYDLPLWQRWAVADSGDDWRDLEASELEQRWQVFAFEMLYEVWREVSPVHESKRPSIRDAEHLRDEHGAWSGLRVGGFDVQQLTMRNVGQAAKYVCKPMTEGKRLDTLDDAVEAYTDEEVTLRVEMVEALWRVKAKKGRRSWHRWQSAARASAVQPLETAEPQPLEATEPEAENAAEGPAAPAPFSLGGMEHIAAQADRGGSCRAAVIHRDDAQRVPRSVSARHAVRAMEAYAEAQRRLPMPRRHWAYQHERGGRASPTGGAPTRDGPPRTHAETSNGRARRQAPP